MTILPTKPPKKRKDEERKVERQPLSAPFRLPMASSSRDLQQVSPPPRKIPRKPNVSSPISNSTLSSPRTSRDDKPSGSGDAANSDDEYEKGFRDDEKDHRFEIRLWKEKKLKIKKVAGDGACMFRAVADQVYGDEEMHEEVRKLCMDYMEKNREHFGQFITEDFSAYIARKRGLTEHGNHVELQAISEMFSRPIEIYQYDIIPINVFHPKIGPSSSGQGEQNAAIRLSYHGRTHYNSVVDPDKATIGVGLGLPGMEPGMADRKLMADAVHKSELAEIEEAMLSDKMEMSDWQRTEEDMKDQVVRESYLDYVRSLDKHGESSNSKKKNRPSSSSQIHDDPDTPSTSSACNHDNSTSLYEDMLAAGMYTDWAEDQTEEALLAEALLLSQQSFMSECQRKSDGDSAGCSKH